MQVFYVNLTYLLCGSVSVTRKGLALITPIRFVPKILIDPCLIGLNQPSKALQ